ncbi:hypothetical protein Verru16b_00703 [Lacunisphaera limnophila]|uniref:Uncharacterized protein n=1 Tax=Lacunisphaera limnophila TaxID=1838286 RepID=A0A1D8ARX8_9BACT|nr:hypothetical protein [Lacunisphaera limnophila]AOS43651.1 hypothetical protein Verru16b_00703 [Lacunisphaera limnophila]
MNPGNKPPASPAQPELTEERYSLRAMLAEVALETQAGSLGTEKLHQPDIRKLFRTRTTRSRGAKN